jgi:hypothetical protein
MSSKGPVFGSEREGDSASFGEGSKDVDVVEEVRRSLRIS